MKRLMLLVLGGLLVSGPAFAQPAAAAKAGEKTLSAAGEVKAVTPTSLTVKGKTAEWTFAVDKATVVKAAGASRKTAALKEEKVPPTISEYVKVGDQVTVKYHDGATKHAAEVLVRSTTPGATKK